MTSGRSLRPQRDRRVDPHRAPAGSQVAETLTVARNPDGETTKGGDAPYREQLRPYLESAIRWSRSEWLFPKPDGKQRSLDLDVTAVLRRALGRAGIVDAYEHRCRRAHGGHVARALGVKPKS